MSSIQVTKKMIDRVNHYINSYSNMTEAWLARNAGVSQSTINKLTSGHTDSMRRETWDKIDKAIGWNFDVQFFGRKLHTGGVDENHQVTVRDAANVSEAWKLVQSRLEFDVVKKISCEIIYPPKTKEELEAEKKLLVESFPANIREYVAFFVHSESTEGLKGEVKILKNMVNEMKASIEKFEAYLRQTSPQSL